MWNMTQYGSIRRKWGKFEPETCACYQLENQSSSTGDNSLKTAPCEQLSHMPRAWKLVTFEQGKVFRQEESCKNAGITTGQGDIMTV